MNDAILEQYNVLSNDIKTLKVKINFIKDCLQTISKKGCIDYVFSLKPHYAVSYTRYELSISQLRILLLNELQTAKDTLAELEKRYADGIR